MASISPVPKGRTKLIKPKPMLTLHTLTMKNSSSWKHYWQQFWPVFLSSCNLVHIPGRGIHNWSKFLLSSNSQAFLLLCHCKGFFHLFLGSFKILKLKHTILMTLRTKCSWFFFSTYWSFFYPTYVRMFNLGTFTKYFKLFVNASELCVCIFKINPVSVVQKEGKFVSKK